MGLYDRDYMRGPQRNPRPGFRDPQEGGAGPNRRWIMVAIVGGLAVIALWGLVNRGLGLWIAPMGPGPYEGPKPKLLQVNTIDLGQFEVVSGEVAVCDPGYDRQLVQKGAIATKVRNVAKGTWQARAVRHVMDNPADVRCGELRAFLASLPVPDAPAWQEIHPDIGVDSGQAGFFDWQHFHSPAVVPRDHPWKGPTLDPKDLWYSLCCDVTLYGPNAGVIPFGAVSSSGWGDGGYRAYALRDATGMVIGLRLVFISLDEYEPAE